MVKPQQKQDKENDLLRVVALRDVQEGDLPLFFEQQLVPEANHMAAFTRKDPTDRETFEAHWSKISGDNEILIKTILWEGHTAGYILSYVESGKTEVSYWIGKEFWGMGIASAALKAFLDVQICRPLYARAAKDNLGSIRVLEKNGFVICGDEVGYANARGEEIEEVVMRLG